MGFTWGLVLEVVLGFLDWFCQVELVCSLHPAAHGISFFAFGDFGLRFAVAKPLVFVQIDSTNKRHQLGWTKIDVQTDEAHEASLPVWFHLSSTKPTKKKNLRFIPQPG